MRPTNSMPAKRHSTCWTASKSSTASARKRPRPTAAVHPDQHRRRHQYRQLRGRQHGLGPALRLFGAGRQRQSRVAAGRTVQILRAADHHRVEDRECRQGQVCHARTRFHRGERQEGAGGGLRHRRPRGHDRLGTISALARAEHENAVALPQPRLARRTGRHRGRPRRRRGEPIPDALQHLLRAHPHFQDNPPPEDWDGAYALDSK